MSESNDSAEILLDEEPMIDPETSPEGNPVEEGREAVLEVEETPEDAPVAPEAELESSELAPDAADEPVEEDAPAQAVVVEVAPEDAEPTAEVEGSETAEVGDEEDSPAAADTEASGDEESAIDGEAAAAAEAEPAAPVKVGPGEELTDDELVQATSALIFASPEPLGTGRLVNLLEKPQPARVKDALAEIKSRLENAGLPLQLREIAGGWRLMTIPEQNETVARLVKARKNEKLSPAGLETLAVVAYRQPVTKADIEAIRGVQCGPMLRNLVDRGLAKVVGRADVPGGPLLYGTTKEFLDRFGMGSLKDLPRDGELLKE